jgi:hypothetical protein
MEIRITYFGTNENGLNGIWCGFKPQNATITEERMILYPEIENVLQDKESGETFDSVWLKDLDDFNNYQEITRKD